MEQKNWYVLEEKPCPDYSRRPPPIPLIPIIFTKFARPLLRSSPRSGHACTDVAEERNGRADTCAFRGRNPWGGGEGGGEFDRCFRAASAIRIRSESADLMFLNVDSVRRDVTKPSLFDNIIPRTAVGGRKLGGTGAAP